MAELAPRFPRDGGLTRALGAIGMAVLLVLGPSGCGFGRDDAPKASWGPPFLPFTISVSTQGNIWVEPRGKSLVTPVGTFGVGDDDLLSRAAGKDATLLVIRHQGAAGVIDDAYRIGQEVVVVLDGRTTLTSSERRIFIDATDGRVQSIRVRHRSDRSPDSDPSSEPHPPDATPGPTPTPEPSPTAEPSPTVAPTPTASALPYTADWSEGMAGWTGTQDWLAVDGKLLNSGDGSGTAASIFAPLTLDPLQSYVVEARMRVVGYPHGGTISAQASFGLVARADDKGVGYGVGHCVASGFFSCNGTEPSTAVLWKSSSSDVLAAEGFKPGEGLHTYRLELRGNELQASIDGTLPLSKTDNSFLRAGSRIGLWSDQAAVEVVHLAVTPL